MDLGAIAEQIPPYAAYFTVDELYASTAKLKQDFPALVYVEEIGASRQSNPIEYIRIGDGELNAVMFGGSHANEPLGCMVVEYFTRALCENADLRGALNYTWHFIKCIDPDATRRNEGWFSAPFTIPKYSRDYFRPPFLMQPEFTFPYQYKDFAFNRPLPETRALMRLLELARPDFFYSLHSGGYGGAFYGVSAPCEPLYQPLQDILYRFGFHILDEEIAGEDLADDTKLTDGIYQHRGLEARYDALEEAGVANPAAHIPHGATGFDYAMKYGAFAFNAEVDCCQDSRIVDRTPTGIPLQTAQAAAATFQHQIARLISEVARPAFNEMHLEFNREIVAILYPDRPQSAGQSLSHRSDRMATVAEAHLYMELPQLHALRTIGQILGLLDDEITSGNPGPAIQTAHDTLTRRFDAIWGSIEHQLQYRVVPLRDLIGYQLCAGLAVAHYVQENRR